MTTCRRGRAYSAQRGANSKAHYRRRLTDVPRIDGDDVAPTCVESDTPKSAQRYRMSSSLRSRHRGRRRRACPDVVGRMRRGKNFLRTMLRLASERER